MHRKRNLLKYLTFLKKWQVNFNYIEFFRWIFSVVFWLLFLFGFFKISLSFLNKSVKYSSLYTMSALWKVITLLHYLLDYAYHLVPFLVRNISTKCSLVALEFTELDGLVGDTATKSPLYKPQNPEKCS